MTPPPHSASHDRPRPALHERRDRDRRVLLIGLAVSLVAHVLAVGVIGAWLDRPAAETREPSTPLLIEPPQGIRMVELTPSDPEADVAVPERPDLEEDLAATAPVVTAATPTTPDTAAADTRTAADRLAPRVVDPRLWRPMILLPREPTFEDVRARVAAAIELMSDSALADAEAAMRALDWTVTDAEGGRWGISPGQLHLGSVTLPIPLMFAPSAEAMAESRQWYELERQLERAMIMQSFEDRVRAIRERRERERAEAAGGERGGGR